MKPPRILPLLLAAVFLLCGCSGATEEPLPSYDEARHTAALNDFWGELSNVPVTDESEFLFHYSEQLQGLIITSYKGDADAVHIPDDINGTPVVKIDLRYCYKNIKSLIIPDSLRDIRLAKYDDIIAHYTDENFTHDWFLSYYYVEELGGCVVNDYYGTDPLVRIPEELPDPDRRSTKWAVKKIELNKCEKEIELLIVPDNVKYIYAEPYSDCLITAGELHAIINESIIMRNGVYSGIGVERLNIPVSFFQDRRITFANSTLTDVFIPESISVLDDALFMDSPLLERTVINAESVTVGAHAFFGCGRLTDIDISRAASVGDWAFSRCVALTNVQLCDKLTDIGAGAFSYCRSLNGITIPASVKYIGENAFLGCGAVNIFIDEDNPHYIYTSGIITKK